MEIAVVGLPASGKSTVFSALSGRGELPSGRRGEIERAVVKVPDERVTLLSALFHPRKTVYAEVQYVAAPDLVGGQNSEGWAGVFTQLRQADAIVQVVRAFESSAYPHPAGSVEPLRDYEQLQDELLLADLLVVERRLERIEKEAKSLKKGQAQPERDLLFRLKQRLDEGLPLIGLQFDEAEAKLLRGYGFLTAKPVLVLFNSGEGGLGDAEAAVSEAMQRQGRRWLSIDGKLERELAELAPAEAAELMEAFGVEEVALTRVVTESYALLELISFFTVGEDEVRAWTIRRGTPAVEAAGEIHSDIERGFIRAEVVGAADLLRLGSLAEARKQALLRSEGRHYEVKDGDVINYLFNV